MISNLSKESGCGCGGSGSSASPCSCGGAGCGSCVAQGIVRPRFFAGQLLTEDDLQSLSDYVGQKNRLHNRHLFGAGVVCGLEVTCDPCGDGRVVVQPGYAIDCCGNDLTLSCPQVVDLNALVRKLRKDDCVDPCPEPKQLKGQTEPKDDAATPKPNFRFCLYIRYCEQPSDPVTPYSTGEDCVQVGCEPTRIREGVSFELRCVDPHTARNPLLERLCLALGDLDRLPRIFDAFRKLNQGFKDFAGEAQKKAEIQSRLDRTRLDNRIDDINNADNEAQTKKLEPKSLLEIKAAFDIVRNWLIERLSKSSFTTDCTLKQRVYDLTLPRLEDQTAAELATAARNSKDLAAMTIDYLRGSVSRVLNPACLPCEDSAVLLACLDWEECEVKRICNMERTFVLSPAAIKYWLPPLQLAGNFLEQILCLPWEDFPRDAEKGNPDPLHILKQEIARLVKDSLCGVSDNSLKKALDGLDKLFGRRSNDHLSMPGSASPAPPPATEKGAGQPVDAAVDSTSAPAASKAPTKKTATKSTKKAAIKTVLKATETPKVPDKPAETAKPAEAQPAATPPPAPAPTSAPAADASSTTTPPKGEGK